MKGPHIFSLKELFSWGELEGPAEPFLFPGLVLKPYRQSLAQAVKSRTLSSAMHRPAGEQSPRADSGCKVSDVKAIWL